MSKSKVFVPSNLPNLELPIMDLKGADYMKVPYRILWMVNDIKPAKKAERYTTNVHFELLTPEVCTVKVTVTTFDADGNQLNQVQDAASEAKKAFNDYVEKAVTSALGRALAQLGYGTAQAIADYDEGQIADSPLGNTTATVNTQQAPSVAETPARPAVTNSFAKPKKEKASPVKVVETPVVPVAADEEDWAC
jgi:hypothetical protein